MSTRILLQTEILKASRRQAFITTTLLFAALALTINGVVWHEASQTSDAGRTGLPGAWAWIMGEQAQLSAVFLAVVVLLIVSAEFSWRTARQNVIDGMSKNEWFLSKVLLIAMLCLLYGGIVIGSGLLLGAFGPFTEFIRVVDVWRMGAYGLSMFGFASFALMIALLIRSPGPAVAVLLFCIMMLENMLEFLLEKFQPSWESALSFLPMKLFFRLFKPIAWYPDAFADAVRAAELQNVAPPDPVHVLPMISAAIGYVVLFLVIGYVDYSRRDL